jgi:hypothetical protein
MGIKDAAEAAEVQLVTASADQGWTRTHVPWGTQSWSELGEFTDEAPEAETKASKRPWRGSHDK